MTVLRLHHVQLAMPPGRENEARAFYAGLLGLKELPKPASLAGRGGCWFGSGPVEVHLGVEAGFTPARKAHPALVVEDLARLALTLARSGCVLRPDEALNGFDRGYIEDPFGNRIELMQEARQPAALYE